MTLLHRRHPRDRGMTPGEPHARARRRHRRAPASAASCTSRPPSPSSSQAPAAGRPRVDGDRDAARTRVADSRPHRGRPRERLLLRAPARPLRDRRSSAAQQTIEPTVTNEEESAALGVPLHSPAFLFERVTRSESGEIVEFVSSIYRGDRYRLVTELSVAADASPDRHADRVVRRRPRGLSWSVPSP